MVWGKEKKRGAGRGKLPSSPWLKEPQKIFIFHLPQNSRRCRSSESFCFKLGFSFPSSTFYNRDVLPGGLRRERGYVGRGGTRCLIFLNVWVTPLGSALRFLHLKERHLALLGRLEILCSIYKRLNLLWSQGGVLIHPKDGDSLLFA